MTKDALSEEDKALFREHMQNVKPLDTSPQEPINIKPKALQKIVPPKQSQANYDYYLSDFIQEPVFPETILSYSIPHLPKQDLQALQKGSLHWDAKLDLHGLTIESARQALVKFLHTHTTEHHRFLLIVHGKGGQQGEPPVIKNQVNRWLPQIDKVLAYQSAQPKDGGTGAVYVLIKS